MLAVGQMLLAVRPVLSKALQCLVPKRHSGIILWMPSANERRWTVMSSVIGWDPVERIHNLTPLDTGFKYNFCTLYSWLKTSNFSQTCMISQYLGVRYKTRMQMALNSIDKHYECPKTGTYFRHTVSTKDYFVYAPSQWKKTLQM